MLSRLASGTIAGARSDLRRLRNKLRSESGRFHEYLETHDTPALHLGAGVAQLPGWLETDIEHGRGVAYLDATRRYPLPDASFQYVYAEHMIEHLPRWGAEIMLKECKRILKSDGVLRLTTPDLDFLLGLRSAGDETSRAYIDWIATTFLEGQEQATPTFVINNAVRSWGHQFIYDFDTLAADLRRAGFGAVKRVAYGKSEHEMLRGIESHHLNVGTEEMVRAETMVVEAT